MLLSDDMEKLSDERLLMAASLVPPINQRPHVLDWKAPGTPARLRLDLTGAVGDWHLLSFSNWRDTPQEVLLFSSDFQLPEKDCFVYFFWGNRSRIVEKDAPLYAGRIAPHQTVWMSVRMRTGGVQYIGGNLHASQGLEISRFTTQPNEISIGFTWDKRLKGSMELFYPETIKDVRLGEQSVPYVQTQLGLVRITFAGNSPDTLQIN